MKLVRDLSRIWDNGAISLESFSVEEIERFKQETGAAKVVGSKWHCNGNEFRCPFYVRTLADRTGVVHFENDQLQSGRLIVLNADGSRRVVITVPRIDANSRPEDGYLSLPPSSAHFGGIEWGCEGNDGYKDYLFDFDWSTGKLLRYARPTRPW